MRSHPPLTALVDRALGLVPARGRAVLGITGLPGAGKTSLAEALVAGVGQRLGADAVAHVPMDGFHLADVTLERLGLRDVKGHPDTFDSAGYAALLRRLLGVADRTVYAPGFERTLEQPVAAAVAVAPSARLVVTEGNYLLLDRPEWRAVAAVPAETWLAEVEDRVRLRRLVDRHVEFGKPPDAAAAWVARSDEANAAIIRAESLPPTLVVTLA